MKQKLDIENWARKEHFHFFKQFDEPYFGVTIEVDCTHAYKKAKEMDISFFLYYLHKSIVAVNQTESFRYRIENDEIFIYNEIHASATINRPNNTFGFSYIPYQEDINKFVEGAKIEINRVQNSNSLLPATNSENVIHYSSLPWIKFTALSHARNFKFQDSVPKISFGKLFDQGNKKLMPYSIHAHHALLDGYDVAQCLELFQELLFK
ncbi:MAG: chloramphenicol acetyltransferase [Bacteroidota bacterium]